MPTRTRERARVGIVRKDWGGGGGGEGVGGGGGGEGGGGREAGEMEAACGPGA